MAVLTRNENCHFWLRTALAIRRPVSSFALASYGGHFLSLRRRLKKWALQGSNLRPQACKACALPAELSARTMASGLKTGRSRAVETTRDEGAGQRLLIVGKHFINLLVYRSPRSSRRHSAITAPACGYCGNLRGRAAPCPLHAKVTHKSFGVYLRVCCAAALSLLFRHHLTFLAIFLPIGTLPHHALSLDAFLSCRQMQLKRQRCERFFHILF